jgi:Tfp pilus assembly major pilin PilA
MITNPKIERKKADITRTEMKMSEIKAKLREQKSDLVNLENEEIVAMFRKEVITEDDFAALMRSRRDAENDDADDSLNERITPAKKREEESTDALSEE